MFVHSAFGGVGRSPRVGIPKIWERAADWRVVVWREAGGGCIDCAGGMVVGARGGEVEGACASSVGSAWAGSDPCFGGGAVDWNGSGVGGGGAVYREARGWKNRWCSFCAKRRGGSQHFAAGHGWRVSLFFESERDFVRERIRIVGGVTRRFSGAFAL